MEVTLLKPHGMCAGVKAALALADDLRAGDCCLHAPVHNRLVTATLAARGVRVVETLEEVPAGVQVLFSAHGVSAATQAEAVRRGLRVLDATCPTVRQLAAAVRDFEAAGLAAVVIGDPEHAETRALQGAGRAVAIVGDVSGAERFGYTVGAGVPLGVVRQTGFDAERAEAIIAMLKVRHPVEVSPVVCGAGAARRQAVREFAGDAVLVLGDAESANTRRLVAAASPRRAFRAGTLAEVQALDFTGVRHLGLTAGAATPEDFVKAVGCWLQTLTS